tara:strand:+ start:5095 stop:5499 length:405 start_codon:yes stop_codon:yes gene_type:complete
MSKASRDKGKRGEREVVTLLKDHLGDDLEIKRNLREQCHDGGMDVIGLDGWAIEVKNYAAVTPSQVKSWWSQACEQAVLSKSKPVLFWKQARRPWCVVVSGHYLFGAKSEWMSDYEFTLSMSAECFCALVREEW